MRANRGHFNKTKSFTSILEIVKYRQNKMFKTSVFLCVLMAVLSQSLGTTVEQLQKLMDNVETAITEYGNYAKSDILDNVKTLESLTSQAQEDINLNLNETAQAYWTEIDQLETEAATNGQNITECVESGNAQLYALNETYFYSQLSLIDTYYDEGNALISNKTFNLDTVMERLIEVKANVSQCLSEDCTDSLKTEVDIYYSWGVQLIYDAYDDVYQYVQVKLPKLLRQTTAIDDESYIADFTSILDTIKACIDQLLL